MDIKNRPIGFMDSGIGGLSVMREAISQLPAENFIFFGDNKNAPYGEKTEEEIKQLSIACGEKLLSEGVKMIVIACNTATTVAVRYLRDNYNIPVVSIEPAIKPALEKSDCATKIITMATPATLSQKRYLDLKERIGQPERVIDVPCGGLVDLIEKGDFESKEIFDYVKNKFLKHRDENISAVVVGCTHYSFITKTIRQAALDVFGKEIAIHDGLYGTVRQVKKILEQNGIKNESSEKGYVRLLSSGNDKCIEIMKRILE